MQTRECGALLELIDLSGFRNDQARCFWSEARFYHPPSNFRVIRSRHIDGNRCFWCQADAGQKLRFGSPRKGGEENVGSQAAIRKGNLSCRGRSKGSRNSGDDLELDPACAESLYFLSS